MNNSSMSVALVGTPNSGKTAIFNALTGDKAKIANYAGVTVEKRFGKIKLHPEVTLIDLPGTYSLRVTSPDEAITRNVVLGQMQEEKAPDAMVVVIDATNLNLGLRMVLELKTLQIPMIVAMNLSDVAFGRGLDIDLNELSKQIGVQVVETVAIRKKGLVELAEQVVKLAHTAHDIEKADPSAKIAVIEAIDGEALYSQVDEVLAQVQKSKMIMPKWHMKLDQFFMHPIYGILFLLVLLFIIFQAVFAWAEPFKEMIEGGAALLGEYASESLSDYPLFQSLLVDGIIAGVGSVLVFLPQIIILFIFILLLEDSGYLSRAVFLFDHLMMKTGLSGRAFIPLLSSFACAIPGVMATRTIQNPIERLMTISVAPLMTCSARLPVYTLLISAVIPDKAVWGIFNLQGITLFILYFAGILSSVIVSLVMNCFMKRKGNTKIFPLLLELQSYRLPDWRNLLSKLWENISMFLLRAGTVIFAVAVLLWVLSSFPAAPEGASGAAIDYSFAGIIGKFIQPIFAPIGFTWEMAVALIPGMAAREVVVGALGTVYALSGSEDQISTSLIPIVAQNWGLPTAFSFLTWYIYAPQCFASLAVVRRETASLKYTIFITTYLFALAYFMSLLAYQITKALM